MSENENDGIIHAFLEAQKVIKAAIKTSKNEFLDSSYANLKDCFDACFEPLHSQGISVSQPTMQEGELFVIRTVLTHTSKETMQDFGVPIIGWMNSKNPPQAFGAGSTYARRYGLCSLVGLATDDDDGQSLTQDEAPPWPEGWGITKMKNEIREFYREMHACSDVDQLDAYKATQGDLIALMKSHYEIGLFGDGKDINGLAKDFKIFREKLKEGEPT